MSMTQSEMEEQASFELGAILSTLAWFKASKAHITLDDEDKLLVKALIETIEIYKNTNPSPNWERIRRKL